MLVRGPYKKHETDAERKMAKRAATKRYRQTKKGKVAYRAADKRYRQTEKGRVIAKRNGRKSILKQYDMTLEDYDQMLIEQNGCCVICGKHWSEFKRRLVVEHNHETGKIRGLTCQNCNAVIGHAFDDIEILQNAIIYLKERD